MKILLFGTTGQLGSAINHKAHKNGYTVINAERKDVELSNIDSLNNYLKNISSLTNIDMIINCAAYTKVDAAETETELAYALNHIAPKVMAQFCLSKNIPLIHFSTDYVFSGKNDTPYSEQDVASPTTIYGLSKLAGDQAIINSKCDHLIFRISWVFHYRFNNFFTKIANKSLTEKNLKIVADQIGTPSYVEDIAEMIFSILPEYCENKQSLNGLYHYTQKGITDWANYSREIILQIGSKAKVADINSASFSTKAIRPSYSVLDCSKFDRVFKMPRENWQDAVARAAVNFRQINNYEQN